MFRRLLRFARSIVDNVMREVFGQVNIVDNLIQQTIRSYIQQVVGGAWQGTAADTFVQKVESVVSQQGFPMREMVFNINTCITNAIDTLDQADKKARSAVDSLNDVFKAVY